MILFPPMNNQPYNRYSSYLTQVFGCRVQKISLDAGLTCPNRDGTKGTSGCLYCDSQGSGTGAYLRTPSITRQIIQGKSFLKKRYGASKFIAYFQSFSNTYAPLEVLAPLYQEALSIEEVVGLSVGTRPDCINPGSWISWPVIKPPIWFGLNTAFSPSVLKP